MAINRFESLHRHELPLQAARERQGASRVIVPIHSQIMSLGRDVRQDRNILRGVFGEVMTQYNEDMEVQIEALRSHEGTDALVPLQGYERFKTDWDLLAHKGKNGFLDLAFRHASGQVSRLVHNRPFVYVNMRGEDGEFYGLNSLNEPAVGMVEKSEKDPDFVLLSPDKMAQYGAAQNGQLVDEQSGIACVVGSGLESEYNPGLKGVAIGFALRSYGVIYANRLLDARLKRLH